jgi:hypothetical protein
MQLSIIVRLRPAKRLRCVASVVPAAGLGLSSMAYAAPPDGTPAGGVVVQSKTADGDAGPEESEKKYGDAKVAFIAPEVGYLFFPRSELEVRGFKAIVDPRNGLIAKAGFAFGGNGLGFEFTPVFVMESGGINPDSAGFGNLNVSVSQGLAGANLFGLGAQTQLVFRLAIKRVVLQAGLGVHGTYLFGKDIEYGTELFGRLPLAVDFHFSPRAAVFGQFAFMSGVTGIKTPFVLPDDGAFASVPFRAELEAAQTPAQVQAWYDAHQGEIESWAVENRDMLPEGYDPQDVATDYVKDQLSQSIRFGKGAGLEFTVGFRF